MEATVLASIIAPPGKSTTFGRRSENLVKFLIKGGFFSVVVSLLSLQAQEQNSHSILLPVPTPGA